MAIFIFAISLGFTDWAKVARADGTNRYWVGGSGSWSDTDHWSTTSGGSSGASAPDSSNNVYFDSNSGLNSGEGTITLDFSALMNNFTSTVGHSYTIDDGANYYGLNVSGSLALESGLTFAGTTSFRLQATTPGQTITTNGDIILDLGIVGIGGWTLQDNLTVTGQFLQANGTFNANNHNITANNFYFYADTGLTPTVYMGSGTWEATGNDNNYYDSPIWTVAQNNNEVVNIYPETSIIKFTDASENSKTFQFVDNNETPEVGKTYNNIWFTGAGTGTIYIQGSNTFNDFKDDGTAAHSLIFTNGTTQTVTTFDVSGTADNLITLDSDDDTNPFTISQSLGIVNSDYLDIYNSIATGGTTFYAGANSINEADSNTGWLFEAAPTVQKHKRPYVDIAPTTTPITSTTTPATTTPITSTTTPATTIPSPVSNLPPIPINPTTPTIAGCPVGNLFSTTIGQPCGENGTTIMVTATPSNILGQIIYNFGAITLKNGSIGEAVKELQKFLNANGYIVAQSGPGSLGKETTKFGRATLLAVKKFQTAYGLKADGLVGPKTKAKMYALVQ